MDAHPKYFYPSIVVAAFAVTLFSLIGIASMAGLLPLAHSGEEAMPAAAEKGPAELRSSPTPAQPASKTEPRRAKRPLIAGAETRAEPPPAPAPSPVQQAACANCGTVDAIKVIERKGEGTGLGAIAGGVAGALLGNQVGKGNGRTAMALAGGAGGAYLGNRIEQDARGTAIYQVRVRMEDGTLRTFEQAQNPSFAVGQRVRIVDESVVPAP